jgi:hypothetical protein
MLPAMGQRESENQCTVLNQDAFLNEDEPYRTSSSEPHNDARKHGRCGHLSAMRKVFVA